MPLEEIDGVRKEKERLTAAYHWLLPERRLSGHALGITCPDNKPTAASKRNKKWKSTVGS